MFDSCNFSHCIKYYMQALGGHRFHTMNAFVVSDKHFTHFYSYKTWIASVRDDGFIIVNSKFDSYSPSTSRQFSRFLREYTSVEFIDVKRAYKELSFGGFDPSDTGEFLWESADFTMGNYVGFSKPVPHHSFLLSSYQRS